jgi:hypothetical protein
VQVWASEEFVTKSMRARECGSTGGLAMHTYGPDGHVHTGQWMVRNIVTKNAFRLYFFLLTHTNRSVQVVNGHLI